MTFTLPDQQYYLYNQMLRTYESSSAMTWMFNVPSGTTSFSFMVYISADMVDDDPPLLDKVWDGSQDMDWSQAANWEGNAAPDSTSAVLVPHAAALLGSQPSLTGDARVEHIRVGVGSTLSQGGFSLTASGNVDAPGEMTGGSVVMTGSQALLRGNVGSLTVTGSTHLQGAARTSGAVSVTGALTLSGNALSISIP
jgi:hypothetical protein